MIIIIKAYYPTKKILDNELEVMVWCDEFAFYDKDRVIEATRQLCRTKENSFDISIASIKNKVHELQLSRKSEEDNRQYQEQWDKLQQPIDKVRAQTISEKIEQCKKKIKQAK